VVIDLWYRLCTTPIFSHVVGNSIGNGNNGQYVCVCGFSVDFGIHCTSFPDEHHIQKQNCTGSFCFHGILDGRFQTIDVIKNSYELSNPR